MIYVSFMIKVGVYIINNICFSHIVLNFTIFPNTKLLKIGQLSLIPYCNKSDEISYDAGKTPTTDMRFVRADIFVCCLIIQAGT